MNIKLKTRAFLAVVAAGGMVLAGGAAAQAGGYNVQVSHGASVTYLSVGGASTIVNSVEVGHNHVISDGTQCNPRVRYRGTLKSGSAVTRTSALQSGCWWGTSWRFGFNPYAEFRSGTRIYGEFYHDGAWVPGVDPNVAIWKL